MIRSDSDSQEQKNIKRQRQKQPPKIATNKNSFSIFQVGMFGRKIKKVQQRYQFSSQQQLNQDQSYINDLKIIQKIIGPPNRKKTYKGIGSFMLQIKNQGKYDIKQKLHSYYGRAKSKLFDPQNQKLILNKKLDQLDFIAQIVQADLVYMQKLHHIQMSLNSLTNIYFLQKLFLQNLSDLDLSKNCIQSIQPLQNCYFPNLNKLALHNNNICRIQTLRKCHFLFLQTILIDNNQINQIGRLSDSCFLNLQEFQIYRNNMVDIPALIKIAQNPELKCKFKYHLNNNLQTAALQKL